MSCRCCGCDEETWFKVKVYTASACLWVGVFVLGCVYIVYWPLALYDQRAKHRWARRVCRVDGYYVTNDDPNRRRRLSDDDSLTYYAVLQVTVDPTESDSYATTAVKFPSWARGVGGETLHGWDTKKEARKWAKQYDVDRTYTCWRQPGDEGTVAISNPGYHYDWQVGVGATCLAVTAAPIVGLFLLAIVMYYVLVIKPQRAHRAEARRLAMVRAKGDARLQTEMV